MAKRGRPKNPNSQRSLLEKKKEAEQLALEAEAKAEQLAAELAEKERLLAEREAKLAEAAREQAEKEAQQQAELDKIKAKLSATILETDTEPEQEPIQEVDEEDFESLEALLNKIPTAEKNPTPEPSAMHIEMDPDGDFDEDFEDDFEEEYEADDEEPEIIQKSTQKGKVKAVIPPKEMADIFVNGFDGILQWAAPFSYQKLAFSRDEMRRFREIQQMGKIDRKKEIIFEESDYDLFARMDDFLDYKKTVPLTEKEIRSLKIPLEVMLEEKGGDIPPGLALVYAATAIALPRFAPQTGFLIAKQFSKLNTNQDETESKPEREGVRTATSDNGDQTAD